MKATKQDTKAKQSLINAITKAVKMTYEQYKDHSVIARSFGSSTYDVIESHSEQQTQNPDTYTCTVTEDDVIYLAQAVDVDNRQDMYYEIAVIIAKNLHKYKKPDTVIINGRTVDWEVALRYMDDEIREAVASYETITSNQEFVDEYAKQHYSDFKEVFEIN